MLFLCQLGCSGETETVGFWACGAEGWLNYVELYSPGRAEHLLLFGRLALPFGRDSVATRFAKPENSRRHWSAPGHMVWGTLGSLGRPPEL